MKKLFTVVFAIVMLSLCSAASAEVLGGDCGYYGGSNVRWELNTDTGVLRIYGSGMMADYLYRFQWSSYWDVIKEIKVEEGVTSIGVNAFHGVSGAKSVSLPSTITQIGEGAFYGCADLEAVELPNSITSIKRHTFYGCRALSQINLPARVNHIGGHAFEYTALIHIELPESVDEIGASAFEQSKLEEITLPNGCKIGEAVFLGCENLKKYKLPDDITEIPARLFYDSAVETLELPAGVTKIGNSAFSETKLTEAILPDSVKELGNFAFSGCSNLVRAAVPGSVGKVGDMAFKGCDKLMEVKLGEGIAELGRGVFTECTSLEGLTLPESLAFMGAEVFNGCSSLKEITLPEGLELIGEHCLGQSGVTEIYIPAGVKNLSAEVFDWADNLAYIHIDPDHPGFYDDNGVMYSKTEPSLKFYPVARPDAEYTVLPGTQSVNLCFYSERSYLKKLILPSSLTGLDRHSFRYAASLEAIEMAQDNPLYTSVDGVVYSKDGKTLMYYPQSKKGAEFSVPEGVTEIWDFALCRNPYIQKISLPESVATIGYGAFGECTSLTELNIPSGITELPGAMLIGSNNVTRLELPDGLEVINSNAFSSAVHRAKLPSTLKLLDLYQGGFGALILPDNMERVAGTPTVLLCRQGSATHEFLQSGDNIFLPSIISPGEESTAIGRAINPINATVNGVLIPIYRVEKQNKYGASHYGWFALESDLKKCGYTFDWDPETRTTTASLPEDTGWMIMKNYNESGPTLTLYSSDIQFVCDGCVIPSVNAGDGDSLIDMWALTDNSPDYEQ
ncbi:MAG: leucine-rich repeat protein [Oscillospiraceae bacterium]|nr:leucine-rich repeat protein [Oscillospiraceae bacterium]